MPDVVIGTEIECCVNRCYFGQQIGNYHEGHPVNGLRDWAIEDDGSIHVPPSLQNDDDDDDPQWIPAEFVSKKSEGYEQFKKRISDFKEFFLKEGADNFDCALNVNSSCGTHVHISIPGLIMYKTVPFKAMEVARDRFFKEVKESKILPPKVKTNIVAQYFRSYSKKGEHEDRYCTDRYKEWNFLSEKDDMGIEWRSPSMSGIDSWEQFDEFWRIILVSIKRFVRIARECSVTEHYIVPCESEIEKKGGVISEEYGILAPKKKIKRHSVFKIPAPVKQEVFFDGEVIDNNRTVVV